MHGRTRAELRRPDVSRLPGIDALSPPVRRLVELQDGVATTSQLGTGGLGPGAVARRVRNGVWQRPHRGVVVLQSGAPSWRQRARAALLAAGAGAALSHRSAGFVHGFVADPGPAVAVSVPAGRVVHRGAGLVVHRRRTMPASGGGLRAVAPAPTVLDLLGRAHDEDEAVGVLCDAVRAGVQPGRVVLELERRGVQRYRELVRSVLADTGTRVESPLELRYDRDVERAHGLPRSDAQHRDRVAGRWIRTDRLFPGLGVRVELDGVLWHAGARGDRDVWRDNAVLVERGDLTLRYRWPHVVATPCATAAQVAAALRARGWASAPTPCGPSCAWV